MQLIFELDSLHHALDYQSQICGTCTLGQYFIQVKLSNPAKLLRQKLRHLPLFREYIESSVWPNSCFFEDSFEPSEPSSRIFQVTVRFARGEWLLVRLEELSAELDSKLIDSALTNRIKSEAGLIQLLFLATFSDSAKIFQNLQSQLLAQAIPLLLNLRYLLRILHVVLEVVKKLVRGVDQVSSLFVSLFHAGVGELLDTLD